MLKHALILSLFTFPLFALPVENTSIESVEQTLETEKAQESSSMEEEELSLLHKKGHRPQVIEIPTKTALAH
jgi:hypothetical protein